MMYFIALTVNKGHFAFNNNIKGVLDFINMLEKDSYCQVVKHKSETSEEHYHVLKHSRYSPNWWKEQKICHVEQVRNVKAYDKYMNNHDVIDKETSGDIPYFESNRDAIIEYLMIYGPVKTVQTYGWEALNKYRQLKEFYEDYKEHIAINGK
jgi:hypothetical protein